MALAYSALSLQSLSFEQVGRLMHEFQTVFVFRSYERYALPLEGKLGMVRLKDLSRSGAEQDGFDGVEEDHEVQQRRHVLDVIKVVLKLADGFLHGRSVVVPHLR